MSAIAQHPSHAVRPTVFRASASAKTPAAPRRRDAVRRWAGYLLSGLPAAFLVVDAAMKLARVPAVEQGMAQSGWPFQLAVTLGVILLSSTILYMIPRTAVLGAILLTAYLGGGVATNLRVGNPLALYVLFPVYFGVMIWGGLYLRDARIRALIPFRGIDA